MKWPRSGISSIMEAVLGSRSVLLGSAPRLLGRLCDWLCLCGLVSGLPHCWCLMMIADGTVVTIWESQRSFLMIWWKTQSRSRISVCWLQWSSTPVWIWRIKSVVANGLCFIYSENVAVGSIVCPLADKLPGHIYFWTLSRTEMSNYIPKFQMM